MIKAVIFDMDDTLFYPEIPFEKALKKFFPKYKDDISEIYQSFRRISDKEIEGVLVGKYDMEAFHQLRIKKTIESFGCKEISNKQAVDFQSCYSEAQKSIQLLNGIKATFDYLKEKEIRLGLLTNGSTEHQLKKVDYLKLGEYMEAADIVVSEETGFSKPDKEIFDLMREKLQLTAEELLYVGDNYENDILGGAHSGWKTLWINHQKMKKDFLKDKQADYEIHSHKELLLLMKQLFH
ncbi:MAG: HAD family hydrolase [Lactovum sp.]